MRVATSNAITQLATASASETVFRSFSGLTANNTANAVTFGYKTGIGKHGGETVERFNGCRVKEVDANRNVTLMCNRCDLSFVHNSNN